MSANHGKIEDLVWASIVLCGKRMVKQKPGWKSSLQSGFFEWCLVIACFSLECIVAWKYQLKKQNLEIVKKGNLPAAEQASMRKQVSLHLWF